MHSKFKVLSVLFILFVGINVSGQTQTDTFTESKFWTVPNGVTQITVECWGAGGGGGSQGGAGGGGGGGAYKITELSNLNDSSYFITVGKGGVGKDDSNGADGGVSKFGSLDSAMGGKGGGFGNGFGNGEQNGTGGLGGTGTYSGGKGANGAKFGGGGGGGAGTKEKGGDAGLDSTNYKMGGLGGDNDGGKGGDGGNADGHDGSLYGGGSRSPGNARKKGGNGGDGVVRITYKIHTPVASDNLTICDDNTANISATSINATHIYWYTETFGGTLVGISSPDSSFSVSPTTTTTYYARGYNEAIEGSFSEDCGSVTVTVSEIPLPIELAAFEAVCKADAKHIRWTTLTEVNNHYFILEKSMNGFDFDFVAQIQGEGNSNQIKHYNYFDIDQSNELIYYRLSQTDFDGTTKTFPMISVNCSKEIEIQIMPNPFKSTININGLPSSGFIEIYGSRGEKIQSIQHHDSNMLEINLEHLKTGIYFVRILDANGVPKIFKIIKN